MSRMRSSVMSVATFDAFFGHDTQMTASERNFSSAVFSSL